MTSLRELLRVGPAVDLKDIDPGSTPGLPGRKVTGKDQKGWAREQLASMAPELARQQEMLYAGAKASGDRRRLLLVLQAMDCGGKDGTIKKVAGAMNPLGLHIVGFGAPTEEELRHDFLWRIRRALPPAGLVGVFNRSHYEDVLIARVESLVPERVWRSRYWQINGFERDLINDGLTPVKVMLHISYDEQRQRLMERLTDPTKHWKYNPADVDARARWTDYQAAYNDALSRCSTDHSPWYVVPADRKWYRDWAVANIVLEALTEMRLSYPRSDFDLDAERRRLEADRTPTMAS
ncbi:PPK2 family polyphosphate kinase [Phytohabitans kaempferiae]|uniref:PPK2 family polyphosphate kinase n=1 Tax=Phytohabitans kaempferiae TaxID=1620943 RepID=A0ABV6MGA6_9ACTN